MAFPSTFQDLQNAVIAKARLDSTVDLQRVKDWVNQIYTHAWVQTEYGAGSATATLTADSVSVAIPAAAIRVKQIRSKSATGTYGQPMQRVSLDRLALYRSLSSTADQATHYAIEQSTVEFWPPAVLNDVLQFSYTTKPTPLSANGDIPAIEEPYASKLIEYGALAEAYEYIKDTMQAYLARQQYDVWMKLFRDHVRAFRSGEEIEPKPTQGLPLQLTEV